MRSFVEERIRHCDRCVKAKTPHLPHCAPLNRIETSQPMELVCIDFLGLEESGGFNSILVLTDHFTKYSQAFPTKNQTAHTTAKILFEHSTLSFPTEDSFRPGSQFLKIRHSAL